MMQSPFEVVSGTSIQIMLVALRKIKRKSNDMRLINLLDLSLVIVIIALMLVVFMHHSPTLQEQS